LLVLGLVLLRAPAVAGQSRPGDILYFENSFIRATSPDGSPRTGFSVFAVPGQFDSLQDMVVGPGGDVFYTRALTTQSAPTEFVRYNALTGSTQVVATSPAGEGQYRGVALERGGTILLAKGNELIRYDPLTGARTVAASGGELRNLFDVDVASDGGIYVSRLSSVSSLDRGLVRIDPATGAQRVVVADPGPETSLGHIAVAPDGRIFTHSDTGRSVLQIDPNTGVITPFYEAPATGPAELFVTDLAFDAAGDLIASDIRQPIAQLTDGRIVRFDLDTARLSVVLFDGTMQNPIAVAVHVPEPTAAAALAAILFPFLARRRRA
jgi:streptogramin lyase